LPPLTNAEWVAQGQKAAWPSDGRMVRTLQTVAEEDSEAAHMIEHASAARFKS